MLAVGFPLVEALYGPQTGKSGTFTTSLHWGVRACVRTWVNTERERESEYTCIRANGGN